MNEEQIKILLQRYRMGLCTPEETAVITRWYDDLAAHGQWDWSTEERMAFEATLRQGIQQEITGSRKENVTGLFFFRVAAAVIFLLLLGGTAYLYLRPVPKQGIIPSQARVFKNDITPGRNSAVLTLADGSTIVLDTARKGDLAIQGNSHIINTGGQLAYTALQGKPAAVVYNTLATQRGNQYQLVLPDGTKVWLNADSRLTYPTIFTGTKRKVELTGEAYFEVVHNAKMPFSVKVGNQEIEDIGTAFNVNAYTDEAVIKTTLVEGGVRVSVLSPPSSLSTVNCQLSIEGDQSSVNSAGKIDLVRDVDIEDVVAWKNGKFRFSSVNIETIMRQAARWYDVEVEYRGRVSETFTGGISRNVNISQLLHILEITKKVKFEIEGKKIIVKPVNTN
jgi:ferric-dicitrate binding protein FerR (iron transport regulator)